MIIHGHRGARGYLPENTLPSFIKAIQMESDAIELDIVVSQDQKLIVSHEPWINEHVCLDQKGAQIQNGKNINFYQLPSSTIQQYDCGGIQHPSFPLQQIQKSEKPTLNEVIEYCKMHYSKWLEPTGSTLLENIRFNIEIKSEPPFYGSYQPHPKEYAKLVYAFLVEHQLQKIALIQCFDNQFLEELHQLDNQLNYGLLVDEHEDIVEKIKQLSFKPSFCNPYYQLLSKEVIGHLHQQKIQSLAWTVNDFDTAQKLIDLGVDGLITDYPDLLTNASLSA